MKILPVSILSALICVSCALPPVLFSARAQTSNFDYYLLNLSWAPEFCHNKPGNPECSGHFGFIVHGLWPQYRNGRYPEFCGQQPGLADPSAMLDIMPDLGLIQHEWLAHGTCSGLAANEYFGLIRKVFKSIRIPQEFAAPTRQFSISLGDLKGRFEQDNPGLTDSEMAVGCGGTYLVAVEICVTKDGKPTPCGSGIRECRVATIRVPKVQ